MTIASDNRGDPEGQTNGHPDPLAPEGVVVTGDHGFVGRYLVAALAARVPWCVGIDRVTAEDVYRVAEKYLLPEQTVVVAVGDLGKIREPLEQLGLGPIRTMGIEDANSMLENDVRSS